MKKRHVLLALFLMLTVALTSCVGTTGEADTAAEDAPAPVTDSQLPVDVPREDLFVADQIFQYNVIDFDCSFWKFY